MKKELHFSFGKVLNEEAISKINQLFESLVSEYRFKKRPISLNFKKAVKIHLPEKNSNNHAHYIHPYPGKIFPYIPALLLSISDLCPIKGRVLDPFSGSGSVLLESITHPFFKRDAFGVEINPLGRLISKVKTTPLKIDEINERSKYLFDQIKRNANKNIYFPGFRNIDFWFSLGTIKKLAAVKYSIDSLLDDNYKDFFYLCFSSIIRKTSRADPYIPPPVKLKIHKYKGSPEKYKFLKAYIKRVENADVTDLFKKAIIETSGKICAINKIKEIEERKVKARIIWDDAKSIKKGSLGIKGYLSREGSRTLRSNSIDLILTSPPYLTAQKYIRTQKLELFWLEMVSEEEFDNLRKEIIGTEKVPIKEINFDYKFGIKSIDSIITWACPLSKERAATIIKYFLDMKKSLIEMYRVLKKGAYCIIVIGNNKVLGKYLETYRLITDLALATGFKLKIILKDKIRGRGMITKRHNSGGLIKEEFVIVLQKE